MSVFDDWELAYESESDDCKMTTESKEKKEKEEKQKEEKRLLVKKQMEETEEVLIEDLFMEQLIFSKRKANEKTQQQNQQNQQNQKKTYQTFYSIFQDPPVKNNNFFLKKEENDRKIKAQVAKKREHFEFLKKQTEIFGDAAIDELQEQYCDFEDKYT